MEMDEADKHIVDADIVISQPFFSILRTKRKNVKAKFKMAITVYRIDHVDFTSCNG